MGLESHRTGLGTFAVVLAGFVLLTAVMFRSWLPHLSGILLGPPEDNLQDFWNTWYAAVAADYRHFFFTTLIRFPEGTVLNYQSFAYPQVFAVAALSRLFGSDRSTIVLLHNLTLLASFPLAGAGAFLLVRRFTGHILASLVGGYVFAFSPWHVQQIMHHAHVSEIGFIPFFVFAYVEGIERKSITWLGAAVIFYALSALCCWYYLFYLAFFMVFHAAFKMVRDRAPLRGWQLWAPLACWCSTLALLSPLLVPMVLGGGSYKGGWDTFVIDLSSFVVPPLTHSLVGGTYGYYTSLANNPWEGTAYLGVANLALLIWLYLRRRRQADPLLWYALAGMAVFGVLACGAFLHVMGRNLWIPLPDLLFWKMPFLSNIRTPSRTMVLVYLFLAIGVGYGLSLMLREHRRIAAVAVMLLILVDFMPANLHATSAACPAVLDVLTADREPGFGVLNWPRNYAAQNEPMFQQTCHRHPVVEAKIARTMSVSLMDRIEAHDLARQREQLRRAHVKYIVMRPPGERLARWMADDGQFAPYLATYPVVARGDGFVVFRVY